jgi:hypothetical protein
MLADSNGAWKKGSRCSDGTCVEVRTVDEGVEVRDGKDPNGTTLRFTPGEWDAFIGSAKDGEFDLQ